MLYWYFGMEVIMVSLIYKHLMWTRRKKVNYKKDPSEKYVILLAYSGEGILVHGELSQIDNFCL